MTSDIQKRADRKYREKCKRLGLCVSCGCSSDRVGKTLCQRCSIKKAQKNKRNYKKQIAFAKENGLCTDCFKEKPMVGHKRCESCVTKIRQGGLTRKAQGLCARCPNPRLVERSYCKDCFIKVLLFRAIGTEDGHEILKQKLLDQDQKCFYSDIPLIVGKNASLDHVIPEAKGGENSVTNLVWCDININLMKRQFFKDDFIKFCNLVMLKNPVDGSAIEDFRVNNNINESHRGKNKPNTVRIK